MKKLALILLCAFMSTSLLEAQVQTPAPSPTANFEQKVGLTDVSLTYSRPSMRGRTIFGNLVPYDKLWRTGANANSVITFSDDVTVNGQTLKAGSYAIFTKPGKSSWDVIFYADTNNWGTPENWDESKVAAKATVEVISLPFEVESFTIDLNNLSNNGASMGIYWENTYVGVPFEVPTTKKAIASIEKTMAGPGAGDYFQAAVYYLQEGKDLDQASMWIDKAISMSGDEPPFWMLRQKSLILAKKGDKKGAISAAKASLAAAEKAGNADYVKLNKDSLKEWGAM
ncbi:DUF2911 domain-containing protein [Zhouia amylolytica]|uniref:Dihydrolipoamide dehydrogenase n=1 Tax=Zhouia amylolytica AD3 TaxID=1286632 RepID=W2US65_9FLAO|nr:DUF2911 domain-containing protein [Zhouia amylolytica]ETN96306.1 protein of unknown function (DUF2911) [Zhouia amylolytica AD3]